MRTLRFLIKPVIIMCLLMMTYGGWTQVTLAEWNFPNNPDNALVDISIPGNSTAFITGVGTQVPTFPVVDGATTAVARTRGWDNGQVTKYWRVIISTSGYTTIKLSSKQSSRPDGPRDFKVQYSVDGTNWFDVPGGSITTADNWTSGNLSNLALPTACADQPALFLRWIMTSNTSVDGGIVGAFSRSEIDEIVVTGDPLSSPPDVTLADWNFPNDPDDAVVDVSIPANSAAVIYTVGTQPPTFPTVVGATTSVARTRGWDNGQNTKYWIVTINTAGYEHIKVNSKQSSRPDGPRDFKVQYSTNLVNWFDIPLAVITTADDWTSAVISQIALPAVCGDQLALSLRWIMTSNASVDGGIVGAFSRSEIDEIVITGDPIPPPSGIVLAEWNFPNAPDDAIVDVSIPLNAGALISTVGAQAPTFPQVDGATTSVARTRGWNDGQNAKYWLVTIGTTGYETIKLSSEQSSRPDGPRDFKVQYSTNGVNWFDVPSGVVTAADEWTTGVLDEIELPDACENQAALSLRWIMTSNTSVDGGTVGAFSRSEIDDIVITGLQLPMNVVPLSSWAIFLGIGLIFLFIIMRLIKFV